MSRPSSTSTFSGNVVEAFPKQAATQLLSPEVAAGPISPSPTQFSFASSPRSVLDFEQQLANDGPRRPSTRSTTGDALGNLRPLTSRSRAQYYQDSFAYKEGHGSSARERVIKDAPIVAELRTNVIIKDEYTLVTDLSHHLSTRYQRPEASIMITVNHSACLLLGGSFEPTYVLTINALPVQLQPTTNKRNAALVQAFMHESIGVTPDRGIVKFVAVHEENLAMNGNTILGDIERVERQQAEEYGTGIKRAMTKSSRKSVVSKAKSSIQLSRNSSKANPGASEVVSPPLPGNGPLDSGVAVNEKGLDQPIAAIDSKIGHKKSEPLLSKMGKRPNSIVHLSPPPIPKQPSTTPQISKRKSFMSVFRR
ncbi:Tautomerase/MIF superfamily [Ampelomyces quisqualis]|uniref:L-dopachrome isomerase n=1 Tax=Ampelomyces quisqualis TaxID=50730 RepID=A0A6A5QFW7_AMPQU|nr:Tautomerase/MIF superfamily [Ampelomyces quisqualis]